MSEFDVPSGRAGPPDGGIVRRLGYRPPLAVDALFAFLAARAIPRVEAVSGLEYRRAVLTGEGATLLRLRPVVQTTLPSAQRIPAIELRLGSAAPADLRTVAAAARHLLDLDADPAAVDAVLARDAALRPLVGANPGTRLPGAFDGFATTVLAILAQGVTLASARTLAGRIAGAFGRPVDLGDERVDRHFPEPGILAAADLSTIGLAGRRQATIRAVAAAMAEGRLDLRSTMDPAAALAALAAIPGIGPWTTAYVALRVLRDPDAFPPDDAAIRAAFRRLGLPADPVAIAARAEAWRPWRGYAVAHLWALA